MDGLPNNIVIRHLEPRLCYTQTLTHTHTQTPTQTRKHTLCESFFLPVTKALTRLLYCYYMTMASFYGEISKAPLLSLAGSEWASFGSSYSS